MERKLESLVETFMAQHPPQTPLNITDFMSQHIRSFANLVQKMSGLSAQIVQFQQSPARHKHSSILVAFTWQTRLLKVKVVKSDWKRLKKCLEEKSILISVAKWAADEVAGDHRESGAVQALAAAVAHNCEATTQLRADLQVTQQELLQQQEQQQQQMHHQQQLHDQQRQQQQEQLFQRQKVARLSHSMDEVHGRVAAVRGDVAGVQVLVAGLTAALDAHKEALPSAVRAAVDSRLSQLTGPEQQFHMLENLAAASRGEEIVHQPEEAGGSEAVTTCAICLSDVMQDDAMGVICSSHAHALHADCCAGLVEAARHHLLEYKCPLCRERRSSSPFLWPPPEWFENASFSPPSTPTASPQPEPEPPQPEPHHQPTFPALTFRSKTPMAPEDIIQDVARIAVICYPTRSAIVSAYALESQWEVRSPHV